MPLPEVPKETGTPPKFEQPVTSIDANEGESVTFETVATGSPLPTVKWYRGTEELTASLDFKVRHNNDAIQCCCSYMSHDRLM